MPVHNQQWNDLLNCSVCLRRFDLDRLPISLGCGHILCRPCISTFQKDLESCPLDQTPQRMVLHNLPVNTSMLELLQVEWRTNADRDPSGVFRSNLLERSTSHEWLAPGGPHDYQAAQKSLESLARAIVLTDGLNKPMQRKIFTLLQCQILVEEGRVKALRAARSISERAVIELILQHQNQQQLTSHLWSAVRGRGCQFLGPAMQEEVLKLVLLALDGGSALSRKVLVMFIVQKLKPQYPQASKTSVGHVVQLLYRASCFKVSKRDGDSSLMELKEEFRLYDALRREHDAQIIQIAQEAGLRIAPEQWSALLYGDQHHKSSMQSIIDKLQTTQFFAQSVQELLIAVQRSGDPGNLGRLRPPLDYLANMDMSPEAKPPSMQQIGIAVEHVVTVVTAFLEFMTTACAAKRQLSHQRSNRHLGESPSGNHSPDMSGLFPSPVTSFATSSSPHRSILETRSLPHFQRVPVPSFNPNMLGSENVMVMDLDGGRQQHPISSVMIHTPSANPLVRMQTTYRPISRQFSVPVHSKLHQSQSVQPDSALHVPFGDERSNRQRLEEDFYIAQTNRRFLMDSDGDNQDGGFRMVAGQARSSWSPTQLSSDNMFPPQNLPLQQRNIGGMTRRLPSSTDNLLNEFARWRDDDGTSHGIHRISSLSNDMQSLSFGHRTHSSDSFPSRSFHAAEVPTMASHDMHHRRMVPSNDFRNRDVPPLSLSFVTSSPVHNGNFVQLPSTSSQNSADWFPPASTTYRLDM